jgi:hypothetical protein
MKGQEEEEEEEAAGSSLLSSAAAAQRAQPARRRGGVAAHQKNATSEEYKKVDGTTLCNVTRQPQAEMRRALGFRLFELSDVTLQQIPIYFRSLMQAY